MAQYHYEGGLAAYFVLTFLSLVLIPLTLSFKQSGATRKPTLCKCPECTEKEARLNKSQGLSPLKYGFKLWVTIVLWALFAVVAYYAATTKSDIQVYNPFEILGIRAGTSEKDIKRHFKKLSVKFHPDKVKLAVNQTMEEVSARFVELTKAYKSLTDETVRQNLEQYGHPDGKQEFSVGIAIPQWIVEGKNSIWVLGFYGLVFMGVLPLVVGRWWFGSRGITKDGVHGSTAALFFKAVTDEASIDELVSLLSRGFYTEQKAIPQNIVHTTAVEDDLNGLETEIKASLASRWGAVAQEEKELTVDEAKAAAKTLEDRENAFLATRHEMEPVPEGETEEGVRYAHAPRWPENRKPSWWVMICNQPGDKVIFGPQKFSDVPEAVPGSSGLSAKGRLYKLQFQSPPNVGTYAFRALFVSDTFVGDDLAMDLSLTVEDVSALSAEEAGAEDEISDPDEDTLAGQMAAMRGGAVKRAADEDEDDESDTDGDESSDDSSDTSDDD
ncbi:secretory subunit [Ceratobasidium sp. 370]|nr:secretory subunit [Ceratobasidium sp. 370]